MLHKNLSINLQVECSEPKNLFGVRYFQFFLMSFTLVIFFGMRTALSVGIIAMVSTEPPDPSIPTYPEWQNSVSDTILSSFLWGYLVTQVVAGQLSEYFGPKWFLVSTMLLGSIFNILIPPLAACWGSMGVIICRVAQGLAQGFLYPCILNLVSKWTPANERSRVSAVVYGGASIGIVTSMPLTGIIADSSWGWPMACYVYGGLGIVWTVIFTFFMAESPSCHKCISVSEKVYIEKNTFLKSGKKVPTPWLELFTSLPMWAIFIASCGSSWGSFTLMTEIPTYMDNIMNFKIKENSQLSCLPYVALIIAGLIAAPIADIIITREYFTIGTTRKIFNSLASFIPASALIALGFVNSDQKNLAIGLLVLAVGTNGWTQCGYLVNPIDISPNHAGTITGIVNCFSTVFSILGPLSVGFFGDDKKDPNVWWNVFRTAAGIYAGCGLFYLCFASGKTQIWNDPEHDPKGEQRVSEIERRNSSIYVVTVAP